MALKLFTDIAFFVLDFLLLYVGLPSQVNEIQLFFPTQTPKHKVYDNY